MNEGYTNSKLIEGLGAMSRLGTTSLVKSLRVAGFAKRGETTLAETMESGSRDNTRLDVDPPEPISVCLFVKGFASVPRLFDPSDDEGFLTWFFDEGCHITISGMAEQVPCTNGYIRIEWPKTLRYSFEFTADNGAEYYYQGAKNLTDWNRFRGWTTLYGGVFERHTDKQVVKSTTAFGRDNFLPKLLDFLWSIRLR
jgi:hypothetical protein